MVITDRYVDSSIAYQAGGRELPESEVRRLSTVATGGLRPDLTVLLDIAPENGLARLTAPADRLEAESVEFHRRVRQTFRDLAAERRDRYLVLDATMSPDQIAAIVLAHAGPLLPPAPSSGLTLGRSLADIRL